MPMLGWSLLNPHCHGPGILAIQVPQPKLPKGTRTNWMAHTPVGHDTWGVG